MAYQVRNLFVLAYANGFTLWHYETRDLARDVFEPNYFANADDLFRHGDRVEVRASDAAVTLCVTRSDSKAAVPVEVAAMSPIVAFT